MPVRYRHTSRRAYWAVAAASVVALVAAVLLLTHRDRDDAGSDASTITRDHRAQRETDRDDQPRRDRRKNRADKTGSERHEEQSSLLTMAPGDIATLSEGPHRAVLTVTSTSGAVVGVKYVFRTGSTYREGRTTADGSWRAEATVRGSAPVALVIGQVVSGTVICTASVDGRVVSTRTSSGSFATVVCGG